MGWYVEYDVDNVIWLVYVYYWVWIFEYGFNVISYEVWDEFFLIDELELMMSIVDEFCVCFGVWLICILFGIFLEMDSIDVLEGG